jgi:thymidylate synthase (FAD)
MEIKLLSHQPLSNAVIGGRTCWNSFHKGGCYQTATDDISDEDREFLSRTINKHKHGSIAEHIVYCFTIKGVSRALLQELSRHRLASPSVRSSRYTLKELKGEEPFYDSKNDYYYSERAEKYIKITHITNVDKASIKALDNLRILVQQNVANDMLKYALPECYLTELTWTINARSLSNFLALRSSPAALWEIRDLTAALFDAIPMTHRFLYEDIIQ